MAHPPRSLRQNLAWLLGIYGAWLVTLALGGAIFYVWSGALRELYLRLRLNPWGFAAYQNAVGLLLIVAWLVLAVAAEGWYRHSGDGARLAGRVARLVAGELVVLLLGFALLRLV